MVTLFLRQGETGKQVLLSFPATTPAEKEEVVSTMEALKSMSKTVTIQGAASEVMNLGLYLSGVDLAAEGEVERIDQLAERLEHMSEVDCDKFVGMLDANKISGTKDILQLTEHLDDYVILPGCSSVQSIGKYLVAAVVTAVVTYHNRDLPFVLEAFVQIVCQSLGSRTYRIDIHAVAACAHDTAQTARSEFQVFIKALYQFGFIWIFQHSFHFSLSFGIVCRGKPFFGFLSHLFNQLLIFHKTFFIY